MKYLRKWAVFVEISMEMYSFTNISIKMDNFIHEIYDFTRKIEVIGHFGQISKNMFILAEISKKWPFLSEL